MRANSGSSSGPAAEQASQTVDAIELLLEGTESAENIAQNLAQIHEPSIKDGDGEHAMDRLWGTVTDATTAFEGVRAKRLANLVIAFHNLPDCQAAGGGVMRTWGGVVWRDLPQWSFNFREWSMRLCYFDYLFGPLY